jgi:hypothetical protein
MIEPNARFIALHCGDESKQLMARHPNAFLLLAQIAMRARFKDCPITGLRTGQAFIGDFREAGIQTQMAYRHAKRILTDCGLATFQGTNKGTVATLVNSMIFSISGETRNEQGNNPATTKQRTRNEPATIKQRSSNEQGTTNHNVHNVHNDHKDTMTQGESQPDLLSASGREVAYPPEIEILWKCFPDTSRARSSKKLLHDAWRKAKGKPDQMELERLVRMWSKSEAWTKDGGQYAPGAHIWFKDRKWECEPPSATPSKPAPVKTVSVPFEHYRKESFLKPIPAEGFIDPDIEDPIPF